jgi:DNA invertase Pin-like site-specific DNA recombinase
VARYRVYVRYSDKHQQYGSSEERQWDIERHRKRAIELAATLVEIPYVDRGKSGFHGDNLEAELGRIKFDIQSGAIPRGDILCVEAHSRLGRLTPIEALDQYLGFLKAGIKLDIKRNLRTWETINGP